MVVGVVIMVGCWRWWWHSGGAIEVMTTVVTAIVRMAVVLVVGVSELSVQFVVKVVMKVVVVGW